MELIHGKQTSRIDPATFAARLVGYREVTIDIGTGDGLYVAYLAKTHPARLVIGIDACREQLRTISRRAPQNVLFVVANALALPDELAGRASALAINFPWGSLLVGLLNGDPALLDGLYRIAQPGATLELRLNAGACIEAGTSLLEGGALVRQALCDRGFRAGSLQQMDADALRACPTTWSRRLAFGRDPHALYLRASVPISRQLHSAQPPDQPPV
ncbi:MAG TPA: class I SAM-dependent methyltransferase [Herpetosiphonaceae bacterium]